MRSKIRTAALLLAATAFVTAATILCLSQAARADVTPIIMPTKPTVPAMTTGATVVPTPDGDGFFHDPTTLPTVAFTPPVTAVPFGGELG